MVPNNRRRSVNPVGRGKKITRRERGKCSRNLGERERRVEWCMSELLACEAEKKRVENPAWWEEIDGGVVAGGMTMRPQMKSPGHFNPEL